MQVRSLIEYEEFVNGIKNTLLQLYNKFLVCKRQLSVDYEEGRISKRDFYRINSFSIIHFDEKENPKYMLSKKECLFIRTYGDISATGELMADLVNKKYLTKLENINRIVDSVRICYFFENLSEEKRKAVFAAMVNTYFDQEIGKITPEIEKMKSALGPNYYASITYQKLASKLRELETEKKSLLQKNETCTIEEFMGMIEHYYDIKLDYYKWYMRRYAKDTYENELSTRDQVSEIKKLNGSTIALNEEQRTINDLNVKLREATTKLSGFSMDLLSATSLDDLFDVVPKKVSWFRRIFKRKKNNKLELFEIFKAFRRSSAFNFYLEHYVIEGSHLAEDSKLKIIFNRYFEMIYGMNIVYVEPQSFKRRLILEVIRYYNKLIDNLNIAIEAHSNVANSISKTIESKTRDIIEFEELKSYYAKEKSSFTTIDSVIRTLGLTVEEIEQLYAELKEYISTNLSREYLDGPILNMKVGS